MFNFSGQSYCRAESLTESSHVTALAAKGVTSGAVLLRGGATLDDHILEHIKNEYGTWCSFSYLDKVHDAGGWKRYAHAHRTRLVATFAPKLPLPADVIPLVVDFWANVGMY